MEKYHLKRRYGRFIVDVLVEDVLIYTCYFKNSDDAFMFIQDRFANQLRSLDYAICETKLRALLFQIQAVAKEYRLPHLSACVIGDYVSAFAHEHDENGEPIEGSYLINFNWGSERQENEIQGR